VSALDGKAAIVTGGSRGIGAAIVRRLAADGAAVLFTYLNDETSAKQVVEELVAAGGRAEAVRADQADVAGLDALFGVAQERLGGLDVLVNNAAINPVTPIAGFTEESFDRVLAVNLRGPFFAIQRAGVALRDNGRIISLSTLNTALPGPGLAAYTATKAALEQVTAVAAREFGPRGITVNCVSPGATDTTLLRDTNPPEALEQLAGWTALGRLGQPADIASVVAFLAGPDAQWITGQNLRATGGFLV
jgi:3-oxoacyl-[acyl-carrier protein] reductase